YGGKIGLPGSVLLRDGEIELHRLVWIERVDPTGSPERLAPGELEPSRAVQQCLASLIDSLAVYRPLQGIELGPRFDLPHYIVGREPPARGAVHEALQVRLQVERIG